MFFFLGLPKEVIEKAEVMWDNLHNSEQQPLLSLKNQSEQSLKE